MRQMNLTRGISFHKTLGIMFIELSGVEWKSSMIDASNCKSVDLNSRINWRALRFGQSLEKTDTCKTTFSFS